MIATCNKCGAMFFTTEEDACTPGVLCVECFRQELRNDRLDEVATDDPDPIIDERSYP
jgi:hypothetical protein